MTILTVADKRCRILRWQSLALDLDQQTVRAGQSVVNASPAEFSLLRLFVTRRNIPLTKDLIMASLFGPDHARDLRQADFLVARLRRLLLPHGLEEAISTVAGRGYAMIDGDRGGIDPSVDRLALVAA